MQLPQEYVDPATGRCCVLLGHLGDPDVPRGFNITVMHQNQPILQSVVFVTARLLTFAECQLIRKDGSSARHKLAESFVKDRLHICDVPTKLWPNHIATGKEAAAAPALGMPNTALAFPLPSSPPLVSASAAVSSPASAPVSVPASAPVSAPASATTATSSLKAPAPASLSAPAPATSSFKAPAVKAVVV